MKKRTVKQYFTSFPCCGDSACTAPCWSWPVTTYRLRWWADDALLAAGNGDPILYGIRLSPNFIFSVSPGDVRHYCDGLRSDEYGSLNLELPRAGGRMRVIDRYPSLPRRQHHG